jgi:hypothetical protein
MFTHKNGHFYLDFRLKGKRVRYRLDETWRNRLERVASLGGIERQRELLEEVLNRLYHKGKWVSKLSTSEKQWVSYHLRD